MTLDELFPRKIYPLRARTQFYFPEKDLLMKQERYYQNPITHISAQDCGVYTSIYTNDGNCIISYAAAHMKNGSSKNYIMRDKDLLEISEAECETIKEKTFGVENFCKLVHLSVISCWESF